MKKNLAKLFALVSFHSESEFIEALRLLEEEIGVAYYFTAVYSCADRLHKLLAYDHKMKLEMLGPFFASQKKLRREAKKLLAEITLGCCSPDRVQTVHETDSPWRCYFSDKIYLQNQLYFAGSSYASCTGNYPAFRVKTALVFFSDLRHLMMS